MPAKDSIPSLEGKNNLINQQFGRWTVLSYAGHRESGHVFWICQCSCGNTRTVMGYRLKNGKSKSCGCLASELFRARIQTHGMTHSREFKSWESAKGRCQNPKDVSYARYGGRGITMCERWSTSFEAFFSDMGPRPANHSLDRINNDGNYEPGNCRWATQKQQDSNKKTNRFVSFNGETLTIMQWSEKTGLPFYTLCKRLNGKSKVPLFEGANLADMKPLKTS